MNDAKKEMAFGERSGAGRGAGGGRDRGPREDRGGGDMERGGGRGFGRRKERTDISLQWQLLVTPHAVRRDRAPRRRVWHIEQ